MINVNKMQVNFNVALQGLGRRDEEAGAVVENTVISIEGTVVHQKPIVPSQFFKGQLWLKRIIKD